MIIDYLNQFDPVASAITVTRDSTNIIDLGAARELGIGEDYAVNLDIRVDTAFTAAGAATLTIAFQGAPDSSGSPGTWTTYAQSAAMAVADLTAGVKLFPIKLPHRALGAAIPRYYKLVYTVATGPFTAGKLSAQLVIDRSDTPAYASGFSTSGF